MPRYSLLQASATNVLQQALEPNTGMQRLTEILTVIHAMPHFSGCSASPMKEVAHCFAGKCWHNDELFMAMFCFPDQATGMSGGH